MIPTTNLCNVGATIGADSASVADRLELSKRIGTFAPF